MIIIRAKSSDVLRLGYLKFELRFLIDHKLRVPGVFVSQDDCVAITL